MGERVLQKVAGRALPLAREALDTIGSDPRAVDIDVDLGEGRRLRGTVPELYGDLLVRVSYSRLGAKHRLQSWVRLLALAASDEDHSWRSLTVGRPQWSRDSVDVSRLGPLDHRALGWLRDLVALRDEGLRSPLALPLKTSLGYARNRRTGMDADTALDKAGWLWRKDGKYDGEVADAEHVLVWGERSRLPGAERVGDGPEPSRFGQVALRVWAPLLESEVGSW
jgi:exodeoxyribonuclease V gamma subunit